MAYRGVILSLNPQPYLSSSRPHRFSLFSYILYISLLQNTRSDRPLRCSPTWASVAVIYACMSCRSVTDVQIGRLARFDFLLAFHSSPHLPLETSILPHYLCPIFRSFSPPVLSAHSSSALLPYVLLSSVSSFSGYRLGLRLLRSNPSLIHNVPEFICTIRPS